MSKKNQHLTRPVVITDAAYQALQRISRLTGLPLGTLTTLAVERAYDPEKNPQFASVLEEARRAVVNAVS